MSDEGDVTGEQPKPGKPGGRKQVSPDNLAKVAATLRAAQPVASSDDPKVTQFSAARRRRSAPVSAIDAVPYGAGDPPRGGGPGGRGGGGAAGWDDGAVILDPKDPLEIAKTWVRSQFMLAGTVTLVHWRSSFLIYEGSVWRMGSESELRNRAYRWLSGCQKVNAKGEISKYCPNQRSVSDVMAALKCVVELIDTVEAPCWIKFEDDRVRRCGDGSPDVKQFLVVANGLFDLGEGALCDPTPTYFATIGSPVSYMVRDDSDGQFRPSAWLSFLSAVWPNDPQAVELLQEWFGYCLTADLSQSKILFMIGPPRSGKGTIMHVLEELVGEINTSWANLGLLGSPFGASTLIGKSVGMIADARIDQQSNKARIIEVLLSTSGGDGQDIDRKHLGVWKGVLPTRLILAANELPYFSDSSGALPSRYLLLHMRESFIGREDIDLINRLRAELPDILVWAIEGRRRLTERGRFVQPESGTNYLRFARDVASDMGQFVRECCELKDPRFDEADRPDYWVDIQDLYSAFKQYSTEQGVSKPPPLKLFAQKLRAACPKIEDRQYRAAGKVRRRYVGIKLKVDDSQLL